jgi:abhydrolase domain-containing protein 1/3
MILSAPFNIFQSALELEKSENYFFNKILTNTLSKYIQRYLHLFQQDSTANYDFHALTRCRSLRDIDTHFVTKQFGYQTLDDYYRDACLDSKVKDIRTPTLFLNAADDMFSPARAFPLDTFSSNPNIAMVMTKYGGHISFTEGFWPSGCNYACRLFKDYLNNIITELQTTNEQILNKNEEKPMFF